MKRSEFIFNHLLDPCQDVLHRLYTDFNISCTEFDELTVSRQSLGTLFIITDEYLLVGERFSYLEDFDKVKIMKVLDECYDLYIELTLAKD